MKSKILSSLLLTIVLSTLCSCESVSLTSSTFEKELAKGKTFVKFYAPWCGHCKKLAPTWDELATTLAPEGISVGKVDCTVETTVCDRFSVTGYPTLLFFADGKYSKYESERSLSSLKSFALSEVPTNALPEDPAKQKVEWTQIEGLTHLTTENFGLVNEGVWLVAFYADWCGFCKRMRPEYEKIPALLKDTDIKVAAANLDLCDVEINRAFGIQHVPTIKLIENGKVFNFTYRSQKAEEFAAWAISGHKSEESSPLPYVKSKPRKQPQATGKSQEASVSIPYWDEIEKLLRTYDLNKQEALIGFAAGMFTFVMGVITGRLTAPSPKPVASAKKTN